MRRGHAPPPRGEGRQARSGGRTQRTAHCSSHLGDDHRSGLRALGAELPRSSPPHQPVGQCGPMGNAPAPVPSHRRVPLAGRPHRPRDDGRSGCRDGQDARRLREIRPRTSGPSGFYRRKVGERALPRRGEHAVHRGHGAGPQSDPSRHFAFSRPELLPRGRNRVRRARRQPAVRLDDELGCEHAPHRHAHHGALGRRRARPPAARSAFANRHSSGLGQGGVPCRGARGGGKSRRAAACADCLRRTDPRGDRPPRCRRRGQKLGVDQKRRPAARGNRSARHRKGQRGRQPPRSRSEGKRISVRE